VTTTLASIISATKTALEAMTLATDSGAPANLKDDTTANFEQAGDRMFSIGISGMTVLEITGVTGRAHMVAILSVHFRTINEARGDTDASAIIAEDSLRVMLRLWANVPAAVTMCRSMTPVPCPAPIRDAAEPSRFTQEVPFEINWDEDIPSS